MEKSLKRLREEATYNSYLSISNRNDGFVNFKPLKIAVLRNYTVEPLLPVITGESFLAGISPDYYLGDFDTISFEVHNPDSKFYEFKPDLIFLCYWPETLFPKVCDRFSGLNDAEIKNEQNNLYDELTLVVSTIRENSKAPVVMNNFPVFKNSSQSILDAQSDFSLTSFILQLNQNIKNEFKNIEDIYLLDLFSIFNNVGAIEAYDERFWQMSKAPLTQKALLAVGKEYGKFIRALNGSVKKCLVLDCDNTLWGGVVGEDGLAGIKLGSTYPGSCFQRFQKEVLNLHDRGILLALCSKNNEQDVLEVFKKHPDMILKEKHIATLQINWEDKASNILQIADNLNIGIDSLVFVDDSPFESQLIREKLPEVAVIELGKNISEYRKQLSSSGYFENLAFSEEDKKRTALYSDEAKRNNIKKKIGSLDDYFHSLGIEIEIAAPSEIEIPRVSQLTQKTNQFNLTSKRYSEGQIEAFIDDNNSDVFYLRAGDKVGDLGIIAVAILIHNHNESLIDTFLVSCRALGRGIEDAFLGHIVNEAIEKRRSKVIKGYYIETDKNSQVKEFYKKFSFNQKDKNEWIYESESNSILNIPKWIKYRSVL